LDKWLAIYFAIAAIFRIPIPMAMPMSMPYVNGFCGFSQLPHIVFITVGGAIKCDLIISRLETGRRRGDQMEIEIYVLFLSLELNANEESRRRNI